MKQTARTTKQIGTILRRARRRRKMSQTDLGHRIGMRQATVSKLESGEPATQIRTLLEVLRALDLQLVITERTRTPNEDLETLF